MDAFILRNGDDVWGVYLTVAEVARIVSENEQWDWTVTPLTKMDSDAEDAADLLVKNYIKEWY